MSDWDRSKQTYFILRRSDPWTVRNMKTQEVVCDYPAFLYDNKLIEQICFAANDEEVREIVGIN